MDARESNGGQGKMQADSPVRAVSDDDAVKASFPLHTAKFKPKLKPKLKQLCATLLNRLILGANHPLFDTGFYRQHTPGLGLFWWAFPLAHYWLFGWREGRNPHPLFLGKWYQKRYLSGKSGNPLWHYVRRGWREDAEPHPLFDTKSFHGQAGSGDGRKTPLTRFLERMDEPNLRPFPLFDEDFYSKRNPTAAREWPGLLLLHYFAHGAEEGSWPNPLFDPDFYRERYLVQEPKTSRLDAFLHYAGEGRLLGYWPNACFDPEFYREEMARTGASPGEEPLIHYLRTGLQQGIYPCREAAELQEKPIISILTPVYNTDENQLWRCVHSVLTQPWPHWQLCLVDDGSIAAHIPAQLADFAHLDPRIKIARMPQNCGIAAATNRAAELADGDYLAFLDHDDELAPDALLRVAQAINEHAPDALYSDESLVNLESRHLDTIFKCAPNPELLRTHNHFMHFFVLRRRLFATVGGLDPGRDGAQDYDLSLKVADMGAKIHHIPQMLYHWRANATSSSINHEQKSYATEAGRLALVESLARTGLDAQAECTELRFFYRTRRKMPENCRVSVCTDGVIAEERRAELVAAWPDLELLEAENEENPSAQVGRRNTQAEQAEGEYLLFLGQGVVRLKPGALAALLEYGEELASGKTAIVGGWLERPQSPHLHRGSLPDLAQPSPLYYASFLRDVSVHQNRFHCAQNTWALPEDFCLIHRARFLAAGGYNSAFRTLAFAQLDLCFRLYAGGASLIYTPWAVAEALALADGEERLALAEQDRRLLQERWQELLSAGLPWYNPNILRHAGIKDAAFRTWLCGQ